MEEKKDKKKMEELLEKLGLTKETKLIEKKSAINSESANV